MDNPLHRDAFSPPENDNANNAETLLAPWKSPTDRARLMTPILLSSKELSTIFQDISGRNESVFSAEIERFEKDNQRHGWPSACARLQRRAPRAKARRQIGERAALIKDPSARASIKSDSDDLEYLERTAELLNGDILTGAIRAQTMSEKSIRQIARTSDKPLSARRWLRKQAKQGVAKLNLHLGLIGGGDQAKHCSQFEIDLRNQQKTRWQKFGEKTILTRGGKQIEMLDVMSASGKNRRNEIYALSKGLEQVSKKNGKTWVFVTLTCPPRMHPNPENGNKKWDGTTPDHAHQWLHQNWRRAEARLRKNGVLVSGVRVAEPHQDACPHWHLLVFCDPHETEIIEETLRSQSGCEHWREEAGLKFVEDDGRATAASYLFKYVLKSINSIEQLTGEAASVDAWRSTWGIRSFQWIGMPPIGLWREFRAQTEMPEAYQIKVGGVYQIDDFSSAAAMQKQMAQQRDERRLWNLRARSLLESAWRAARRGDASAFISLSGGTNIKRSGRPLSVRTESDPASATRATAFLDRTTGEQIFVEKEKWQITRKPAPTLKVAVIQNYPRKSKAETQNHSNRVFYLPTGRVDGGGGGKAGPRMRLRLPPPGWRGLSPPAPARSRDKRRQARVSSFCVSDRPKAGERGFNGM